MRNLSRVAQFYILGTIMLGGLGGIWCLRYLDLAHPVALLFACVLATLFQVLKIEGATARSSYSLSWIVYAAVFVGMGWPEMLITITVAHLGEWLRHRYPWYIQSFNIAVYSITALLAGLVYEGLIAFSVDFYGTDFYGASQAFAVLTAMVVFTLVNHFMVGLVIKWARGQSLRESGVFTLTTLTIDFGLLCLGVSAAIVIQTNPAAVVFLVIVAFTLQSVLRMPALEREAERTAELAQAAQAKYEFVATMNHELRTPLNAILLYAESLHRKLFGLLSERQGRAVRGILESAQHLLLIINDILDVAKIDAGRLGLAIKATVVENVCQSSVMLVSEMAIKRQLDLHYHRSPDVVQMDVDELRLKQMLVNLLSNAIKFTPEGGQIGLEVSGDAESNTVHFTVWDTGIGLSQENIQMLFQPFVQLDIDHAQHQGGTGLGLFLVHSMAALHGGSVSVTSEINQGSRFTISLPWYRVQHPLKIDGQMPPISTHRDAPQAETPLVEALNGRISNSMAVTVKTRTSPSDGIPSVLIADDHEENLQLLSDFLRKWHCSVLVARTGIKAVEQATEMHPALILINIHMPEMDGVEAIRRIRAEPSLCHIPIVVLTALATPEGREQGLAAGADDYLNKPIQVERLTEVLDTYLGSMSARELA